MSLHEAELLLHEPEEGKPEVHFSEFALGFPVSAKAQISSRRPNETH